MNDLVKTSTNNALENIPTSAHSLEELNNVIKSTGKFMPRVQFMSSQSEKCKVEDFPVNSFALVDGQDYVPLGKEIDVFPLAWRFKALDFSDEIVVSVYDPNSEEFKRIKEQSEIREAKCMYGIEFLIWLQSQQTFATIFAGSKSSRSEAKMIVSRIGKCTTLKPKKIQTTQHTWFIFTGVPSTVAMNLPDKEVLMNEISKFINPVAKELAPAETRER